MLTASQAVSHSNFPLPYLFLTPKPFSSIWPLLPFWSNRNLLCLWHSQARRCAVPGMHSEGQEPDNGMQAEGKLWPKVLAGPAGFSLSVSKPFAVLDWWCSQLYNNHCQCLHKSSLDSSRRLFHSLARLVFFFFRWKRRFKNFAERKLSFKYMVLFQIAT